MKEILFIPTLRRANVIFRLNKQAKCKQHVMFFSSHYLISLSLYIVIMSKTEKQFAAEEKLL